MGERGPISSRSIAAIACVAAAALIAPVASDAHPAYVDRDFTGLEDPQCGVPSNPCDTIAEGIQHAEAGLQVIVDDSPSPYVENMTLGGNKTLIAQNINATVEGPTTIDGGAQSAVTIPAGEFATVSGFHLRGNASAVRLDGRGTIANNTFDDPEQATDADVDVIGAGPTLITQNVFTDLDAVSPDTAISVAGPTASANLNRNTIKGYATGVDVADTTGEVTLESDLLVGNHGVGIAMSDDVPVGSGQGDVSATTVTLWDNGTDISNADADLTLDSSIAEDPIADAGTATCAITFSRGPLSGSGCDGFQTTANPGFVNPGAGDYHLTSASPMIDSGNPAMPTVSRDIDNEQRALDGNGDGACPVERDIGADEFPGAFLDCLPPPDPPPPAQPQSDTTPPETRIDSGPAVKTKSTSARFAFGSSEPGSTFECRLDTGDFQPCASPHAVKVKKGAHTFEVRARDAAGNVDPTPASSSWTVKKKKKKR